MLIQAIALMHDLMASPTSHNFFAASDLNYKASVIYRGLATMSGRLGHMQSTCAYSQHAFMHIINTLQHAPADHVDFVSYTRHYVKCSMLVMNCLMKGRQFNDALLLGKEVSDMAERIFYEKSEETSQMGSLLLDMYVHRLAVIRTARQRAADTTVDGPDRGRADTERSKRFTSNDEVRMIVDNIRSLTAAMNLQLSEAQRVVVNDITESL